MTVNIIDELKFVLDLFIDELKLIFKDKLLSVLLYGSVVLNDFKPSKGDIDFIVILKNNIDDNEINNIIELHEELRNNKLGILGSQLEGSYYPKQMFLNKNDNYRGYYVGTSRKGWKEVSDLKLNDFDLKNIIDNGLVIYGVDYRYLMKQPTIDDLKLLFINELDNRIMYLDKCKEISFLIDTIYLTLRGIYLYKYEKLVSKSEAINNYLECIEDNDEYNFIKYVSKYRLPLENEEIDTMYIEENSIEWLNKVYEKCK